jgi:hypothetical protein
VSRLTLCRVGANLFCKWGTIRVHTLRMLKVNHTDYSTAPLEPALESEHQEGIASAKENGDGDNDSRAYEGVDAPECAGDDGTGPGDQDAGTRTGNSAVESVLRKRGQRLRRLACRRMMR